MVPKTLRKTPNPLSLFRSQPPQPICLDFQGRIALCIACPTILSNLSLRFFFTSTIIISNNLSFSICYENIIDIAFLFFFFLFFFVPLDESESQSLYFLFIVGRMRCMSDANLVEIIMTMSLEWSFQLILHIRNLNNIHNISVPHFFFVFSSPTRSKSIICRQLAGQYI